MQDCPADERAGMKKQSRAPPLAPEHQSGSGCSPSEPVERECLMTRRGKEEQQYSPEAQRNFEAW
jgi:hypothetical protein